MAESTDDEVALEKVEAVFKTQNGKTWEDWEVLEMWVDEELGQPYCGRLDLAAPNRDFNFSGLLGKSCVLVLSRGMDRKRFFKGLVFRVERLGGYPVASVVRVDFAAALWALHHGQDSQIFENCTVPQVIEEVVKEALEPFGREVRLNLSSEYQPREYCVQYNESDWDFVQRLMADEGISFYFDQGQKEEAAETVVLVDSNDSFPEIETME